MGGPQPTVFTIGYEKLLPPELVNELKVNDVQRVIDVRFRPQSRRPGMSKTRFALMLADHRIVYEHRRELGTPPDIRHDYKAGRIDAGMARFRDYIEREHADALDDLAEELTSEGVPPTALMCLEDDPACCHRRVLTEALRQRRPDLRVIDL
ncbi:MAG: DUF488 domain-containing protein [Solirubrobacteraceae bacterium]|nr:DUF488 domain-containing protein [Solirubrobacteraceae bacterium]